MPQTQDTDDNVAPVNQFAPLTADMHLSVAERTAPAIVGPIVTDRSIWPLAPWRWVLLLVAVAIAIPCGIAAAEPQINGAELGCLIALGTFVAAFTPGRD